MTHQMKKAVLITAALVFVSLSAMAQPYIVPGTGSMLTSARHAGEAGSYVGQAHAAIATCNKPDFDSALQQLKNMEQAMNLASKEGTGGIFVYPGGKEAAAADKLKIKEVRANLKSVWESIQNGPPCVEPEETVEPEEAKTENAVNTPAVQPVSTLKNNYDTILFPGGWKASYNKAELAIKNCNRTSFVQAMRRLNSIGDDLDYDEDWEGLDDLEADMDFLEAMWKEKCGNGSLPEDYHAQIGMYVQGGIATGLINLGKSNDYAGSEIAGGGNRTLGDISTTDHAHTYGFDFKVGFDDASQLKYFSPSFSGLEWGASFGVSDRDAEFKSQLNYYMPSGTRTTLLPGTGVGPNASGFSIASPNGAISDTTFEGKYDYTAYDLRLKAPALKIKNTRSQFRPIGGVRFEDHEYNLSFMGRLPSVALDFEYNTDIENTFWNPYFGFEYFLGWAAGDIDVPLGITASAVYGVALNDASGMDSLRVTGFNTEPAHFSNDDITHNFRADVGLVINEGRGFQTKLSAGYEYDDNSPYIYRVGSMPTQLKFEDSHTAEGKIEFIFKF